MKTVIFSHGFGVRADSNGLFTDIANELTDYNFILFDYNNVDSDGNTVVSSLEEQARRLQFIIDQQQNDFMLLGHSQGCLIIGLVDYSKAEKVILLAPPIDIDLQVIVDKMMKRPKSKIKTNGMLKLEKSNGAFKIMPYDYPQKLKEHKFFDIYQNIANTKPTLIVRCLNDEIVGLTNVDEIKNSERLDLETDHNFTDNLRAELITEISKFIS